MMGNLCARCQKPSQHGVRVIIALRETPLFRETVLQRYSMCADCITTIKGIPLLPVPGNLTIGQPWDFTLLLTPY